MPPARSEPSACGPAADRRRRLDPEELARVDEVAGLFRRGDALLAEPIPDVTRALSRLRIEGSVLEGAELAGLHRLLVAARLVARRSETGGRSMAPLAGSLARPLPDKRIERRLEQSVDPEGNLLDTASPRLAAARREVQAARQRLLRRLERCCAVSTRAPRRPMPSVTMRGGRYVIPVRRDSRSRPGRHRSRRVRQRRHALHRAIGRDRAGQRAARGAGRRGAGGAASASRADRPVAAPAAAAARTRSRCAWRSTTWSPGQGTP